MPIQFYNTLTRRKEEFRPLVPGKVKLYTCGPTVYAAAHIGNFRAFMFEDLLKRYLKFKGFRVTHIMNITDVDDRTITRSLQQKIALRDLTTKYLHQFQCDLECLKIQPADHYPRATEHVEDMLAMIKILVDRGHAYQAGDGSIYFSIRSYPDYGRLAALDLSSQRSTERVAADDYTKDSPQDFALWKAWKPEEGEVWWDSPWGKGRPGWHIECSAMSTKYLGHTFDIHCGGVDNIFPHHENELAQSVCATGEIFVRYWMHCEHLLIEGGKMSKSLGNFYQISELLDQGFTPESLRLILLTTHYRTKLNFSLDKKHESNRAIQRIRELRERLVELAGEEEEQSGPRPARPELDRFEAILDDDLDLVNALAWFFEWIRRMNTRLDAGRVSRKEAGRGCYFIDRVNTILDVLGGEIAVPDEILDLLRRRTEARQARDWQRADALREQISSRGWIVEDGPEGPKVKPRN